MQKLLLFLLFCHSSSAVKHTMKFFSVVSDGVKNIPEVVIVGQLDDIQAGHYDSDKNELDPKQTWMKRALDENPEHLQWYAGECFDRTPNFFKARIHHLKGRFNQSEGVHILQRMSGCEWDDETGEVVGFNQYGYDGEDFLSLDLKTLTWVAAKPQAVITKLRWDTDKWRIKHNENFFTQICPEWLKMYLRYGENFLLKTVRPSVSLLQKTPSSPVSCHATGFYPHRALMFWTRDGEELYEDVDHGEILPNHDGSFQMSVDLDVSSVKAEDWRSYDCVFQLPGVTDDIVTKLDKAQIRSNMEKPSDPTITIISVVVPPTLFIGVLAYKRKKAKQPPSSPESSSELSLNSETGLTNN